MRHLTNIQQALYVEALTDMRSFCKINRLKPPDIKLDLHPDKSADEDRLCGFYTWGTNYLLIKPKNCIPPAKTPGWNWHYPRYMTDLTVYGVILHEFGHYIHYKFRTLDKNTRFFAKRNKKTKQIDIYGTTADNIKLPVFYETPVSKYALDIFESTAEMFRLFVGNPDLLRCAFPSQYQYLTDIFKLKPSINQTWRERLGADVNLRYITQCERKIKLNKYA